MIAATFELYNLNCGINYYFVSGTKFRLNFNVSRLTESLEINIQAKTKLIFENTGYQEK